jgi:hypothetical protein
MTRWQDVDPELTRRLAAFEHDLKKASDGLESGIRALGQGDIEGARTVIGLTHYALGRLEEHRTAAVELLNDIAAGESEGKAS